MASQPFNPGMQPQNPWMGGGAGMGGFNPYGGQNMMQLRQLNGGNGWGF
jgi:hypothetical protein